MRIWPPVILLLSWACAQAQTLGELRYHDGTVLPGSLTESTAKGGVFHSTRFGDLSFSHAEATFIPKEPDAPPLPIKEDRQAEMTWQPNTWSIGLSGYWRSDNGSQESDLNLDLGATWTSPHDELNMQLSADYKVVDDAVDNNEQSGRIRWLHDLASPWFALGTVRAQRHTFTVDPLPEFDYLLMQGTLGLGVRKIWDNGSRTLVALGHDWIALDLLNIDRTFHTSATSLLVESHIKLTTKVSIDQTLYFYLWQDGDAGVDSLAELNYAITERLSVGLRHEYRRNAVNLDVGTFNKLSLTTRLAF